MYTKKFKPPPMKQKLAIAANMPHKNGHNSLNMHATEMFLVPKDGQ